MSGSSDDFGGRSRPKRQSHKSFDVFVSTKFVFLNFSFAEGGMGSQSNSRPPAGCTNVGNLPTQTSHLGTDICSPVIPRSNLGHHLRFSFFFLFLLSIMQYKFFQSNKFDSVMAAIMQMGSLHQVTVRTVVAICRNYRDSTLP